MTADEAPEDDATETRQDESSRLLRSLMEECLERVESDGFPVVDELCERHPEVASDLRRRLKQLFDLGLLGELPTASEKEFPERLGEFRLTRCLGGGGMGVVYLAEQESLGRRVALKLVRPEHLYFPGARERFHREAEAVAKLKHPGIVAIHAVGEENGLPFFAMEWVEGATLAEVIHDLRDEDDGLRGRDFARAVRGRVGEADDGADEGDSWRWGTWTESCVRIVRDVARALDHAHRQGVLHRDVKPSNVMVTTSGRVLLLDFGLASFGDAEPITKSGSQMGSMAYMAAEQVRAEADEIDARTDVYALGATLYELIARRRAFPESDAARVQMKILSGDVEALSRHRRDVPWDVETVVQKAMDPEPGRRYASAGDFARDLDAILDHRPIVAARAGPVRRLHLWTRRHPAKAVAALLLLVLVVVLPTSIFMVQARAAARVRASLDATLDAMAALYLRMNDPEVGQHPATVELRLQVLDDARKLFDDLRVTDDDPVDVRIRLARLRNSVADLLSLVGRPTEAQAEYAAAIREAERIGTPEAELLAIRVIDSLAVSRMDVGDSESAARLVDDGLRRLEADNRGVLRLI